MSLGFEPSPLFSTLSRSCADQYLWRVVWLSGVPQGTAPPPQGIKMPSVKTERSNSLPEKQKMTISWFFCFSVFCSQCSEVWYGDFFFSVFALIGMIFHVFGRQTFVMIFAATIFHFTGLQTVALLKKLKRGKTRRWQILTDSSTRLATIAYFKKLFPRCLHFCTQTFIDLESKLESCPHPCAPNTRLRYICQKITWPNSNPCPLEVLSQYCVNLNIFRLVWTCVYLTKYLMILLNFV